MSLSTVTTGAGTLRGSVSVSPSPTVRIHVGGPRPRQRTCWCRSDGSSRPTRTYTQLAELPRSPRVFGPPPLDLTGGSTCGSDRSSRDSVQSSSFLLVFGPEPETIDEGPVLHHGSFVEALLSDETETQCRGSLSTCHKHLLPGVWVGPGRGWIFPRTPNPKRSDPNTHTGPRNRVRWAARPVS